MLKQHIGISDSSMVSTHRVRPISNAMRVTFVYDPALLAAQKYTLKTPLLCSHCNNIPLSASQARTPDRASNDLLTTR